MILPRVDEEAEAAREELVQEKGFFILPSELFCNVRAKSQNDENLNETLECGEMIDIAVFNAKIEKIVMRESIKNIIKEIESSGPTVRGGE